MCHSAFTMLVRNWPKIQNLYINFAFPVGQDLDVPLVSEDEVKQNKFLGRTCVPFKAWSWLRGRLRHEGMIPYEIDPPNTEMARGAAPATGASSSLFWSGGRLKEQEKNRSFWEIRWVHKDFLHYFIRTRELKGWPASTHNSCHCTQS